MEQIWTFITTLAKGVKQGVNQYITNDLENYVPFFIFAAVVLVGSQLWKLIQKFKNKNK